MNKMHEGEPDFSVELVEKLVEEQFPHWSGLGVSLLDGGGTANVLFRLGGDKVIRLPRTQGGVRQIEKEFEWLPLLAPKLPLQVPVPVARGEASPLFSSPWSVYDWIEGEDATSGRLKEPEKTAEGLANFLLALQQIDTKGGPPSGPQNFLRGVPLIEKDKQTCEAIQQLEGKVDTKHALRVWKQAVNAPRWDKKAVWVHGDLLPGNLLVENGCVTAVIDFGGLGVGDPACEMLVAWSFFTASMRELFREIFPVDEDTWLRGKGWALCFALIALPYYEKTNPKLARVALRTIEEVLESEK